jgi:hypothetical protein
MREYDIRKDVKKIGRGLDSLGSGHGPVWGHREHGNELSGYVNGGGF